MPDLPEQLEGLERFKFGSEGWPGGTWRLRRNDDGEWVKFEDAQARIGEVERERDEAEFGRDKALEVIEYEKPRHEAAEQRMAELETAIRKHSVRTTGARDADLYAALQPHEQDSEEGK